ncbi:hypothetical protein O0L34_g16173 [Tuta absoluta]|nr:hypothetical protein O0L34_g16173 [Tuta absoluta]
MNVFFERLGVCVCVCVCVLPLVRVQGVQRAWRHVFRERVQLKIWWFWSSHRAQVLAVDEVADARGLCVCVCVCVLPLVRVQGVQRAWRHVFRERVQLKIWWFWSSHRAQVLAVDEVADARGLCVCVCVCVLPLVRVQGVQRAWRHVFRERVQLKIWWFWSSHRAQVLAVDEVADARGLCVCVCVCVTAGARAGRAARVAARLQGARPAEDLVVLEQPQSPGAGGG